MENELQHSCYVKLSFYHIPNLHGEFIFNHFYVPKYFFSVTSFKSTFSISICYPDKFHVGHFRSKNPKTSRSNNIMWFRTEKNRITQDHFCLYTRWHFMQRIHSCVWSGTFLVWNYMHREVMICNPTTSGHAIPTTSGHVLAVFQSCLSLTITLSS